MQAFWDYQIEHAGINTLQVRLPDAAESVQFRGEHLIDFIAGDEPGPNGRLWEIKLQRRVIGPYQIRADFQIPTPYTTYIQ